MKLNPELSSFVRDRKPSNEEHPYILWEESDHENITKFLKSCIPSNSEYLLINHQEYFDPDGNYPFTYLRQHISRCSKRRQSKGVEKVWEKVYELFPNYDQLDSANCLAGSVRNFRNAEDEIKELTEELFPQEESNAT